MSYGIIYDKQFIRVKKDNKTLYVPMVLSGCSNVYDTNYNGKSERRTRSWFPFTLNVGLLGSIEQFVTYWENVRAGVIERTNERIGTDYFTAYDDKAFGYWSGLSVGGRSTSGTTYASVVGTFTTGAKKSLTIEQLACENVSVWVVSGYITSEEYKLGYNKYFSRVNNDVELFEAIAECNKIFEGSKISTTIEFMGMSEDKPKRIRNKYFKSVPKEKVKKVVNESYKISVNGYKYFLKETSRNMVYNNTGKTFVSKTEVFKKLAHLQGKGYKCTFGIEVITNPIEIFV